MYILYIMSIFLYIFLFNKKYYFLSFFIFTTDKKYHLNGNSKACLVRIWIHTLWEFSEFTEYHIAHV